MTDHEQLRQIQSLVENAQTVLVMYVSNPSLDELASAAVLQQSLKEAGKDASLYSPVKPNLGDMADAVQATRTEVGNQNLVISFDYSEESVDKVSYHIGEETNKFYLTIKPKRGQEPLNSEKVEFSYTGAEADLIILVGIHNFENLEQLYFGYEDLYRNTPIITLNMIPSNLGAVNLSSGASALSEVAAGLIKDLQLPLNAKTATSLLRGIDEVTGGLQSPDVTADTFEAVAHLMRNGAERMGYQPQLHQVQYQQPQYEQSVQEREVKEYRVAGWKSEENAESEMQVVRAQKQQQKQQQRKEQQHNAGGQQKKKDKKQSGGLDYSPKDVSKK